jgi:hypothetical protein
MMVARPPLDFRGETTLSIGTVMAKKAISQKGEPGPRNALVALKCRQEYKDWITEVARQFRTTPTQIIDQALVTFAEVKGLKSPPER